VRAFGVQAPTVLAPQPLRRLLHLTPRLCNHPRTPNTNQTDALLQHSSGEFQEAINAHLWTAPSRRRPGRRRDRPCRRAHRRRRRKRRMRRTKKAGASRGAPTSRITGVAAGAGDGTRAAHVGETFKGRRRRGSPRTGESERGGGGLSRWGRIR
jgi:hypothetical protein